MIRYKKEFSPLDLKSYQEKFKSAKIASLEKQIKQLEQEAA